MSPQENPTNADIVNVLEQIANLLEAQGANTHRVRAYRDGANAVRDSKKPVADYVAADDRQELMALPGIG